MITYVFPGQGSQAKGMGREFFDGYKNLISRVDAILGYSIEEICLENPNRCLSQTQYTQVAVYVVNALSYLKRVDGIEEKPDYAAGHSLGEYNALLAAEVFDFETGLRLVKKRGELMAQAKEGGMAAVLGLEEKNVVKILKESGLDTINIANYNTPFQQVIAGPKGDIDLVASFFESTGSKFIPLNVSGAFHTQLMKMASKEFEIFIEGFDFSPPNIPVISNFTARPHRPEYVKKNFVEQIINPIKWTESIQYLMEQGKMRFEEIGHGTVLTKMITEIEKTAEPLMIPDINMVEKAIIDEEKKEKESEKTDLKEARSDTVMISNPTEKAREEASKETAAEITASNAKSEEKTVADDKKKEEEFKKTTAKKTKSDIARTSRPTKKARRETSLEPESGITATTLGNDEFKKEYNLKYPYVTGGMYRGIASKELIVRAGRAGILSYFGTGGLDLHLIEEAIQYIQNGLDDEQPYGMNLLSGPLEEKTVDLFLKYRIRNVEAGTYMQLTPALVKYRLKGLSRNGQNQTVLSKNRIMAKVSRPEVAEKFVSPPPERIIMKLLKNRVVTEMEAELSREVPMADDICVEADSGGHTDQGVAYALMPAMCRLRDEMMEKNRYFKRIRIGAAGGIGTPEAAAAAFMLGADFILTGSINQCTAEAGTSDAVKDLLQQMNVQDTEYAPAGDMFEMGTKVQVLRKGLFFPARANKLYNIYQQYNSLDEIDERTKNQLQERFFRRTVEQVYEEIKKILSTTDPKQIERAEQNPKHKMALVFRWYFNHSTELAMRGSEEQKVDYQVPCGPALGAFNQWVKGTILENWRNRHVDEIAEKLMQETARLMNQRFQSMHGNM